jgi:hypothetical protein
MEKFESYGARFVFVDLCRAVDHFYQNWEPFPPLVAFEGVMHSFMSVSAMDCRKV